MIENLLTIALWFCAIGCGLMAGIYFAFSGFVMSSFARIETAAGILAMQSINDVILRSAFMPIFFGTSVGAVVIAASTVSDFTGPGAILKFGAGALYFTGMLVTTLIVNVPLNNKLKHADAYSAHGAEIWDDYLQRWTRWNHVRTITSLVSSILFFIAIKGNFS